MRLQDQEETIQKMVEDCNQQERRVDTVLRSWREKLEQEPTSLAPFQIDKIVREVRQRLNALEKK